MQGITATTDQPRDVTIQWDAVPGATSYRLFRCDTSECVANDGWTDLTEGLLSTTTFIDASVVSASLPETPAELRATQNRTELVVVTWPEVPPTRPPEYFYRVVPVIDGSEGQPSAVAAGRAALLPIVGYEVRIDGGDWIAVSGGPALQWQDHDAAPATLTPGTVIASQGDYLEFVRVEVMGHAAVGGTARRYEVRAQSENGFGLPSQPTEGWRWATPLSLHWERTIQETPINFEKLDEATATTYDDYTAPADGSVVWYRVVLQAPGADTVASEARPGARQPPVDTPQSVTATTDLTDKVVLQWDAVDRAVGYHVFRDGERITAGTGLSVTSYEDFSSPTPIWTAPEINVVGNYTSQVVLEWTVPAQPLGKAVKYRIQATSEDGPGLLSDFAVGRRATGAIGSYLVGYRESTQTGECEPEIPVTGLTWSHLDAPAGSIVPGSLSASIEEYRDAVHLEVTGATVEVGAEVRYCVQGVIEGQLGLTPVSRIAYGRRGVGSLSYEWQRATELGEFLPIATTQDASLNDDTAPPDGTLAFYKVSLSAAGTVMRTPDATSGSRLAFNVIDGGVAHTCALSRAGQVWCWGSNSFGQLGLGHGFDALYPRPVTTPAGALSFKSLSAGAYHTCAVAYFGEVWCWGWNSHGQAGDGLVGSAVSAPRKILGLTGAAIGLATGYASSCAIVANGGVRCWGDNDSGTLGNGSRVDSPIPVPVLTAPSIELTGVHGLTSSTGGFVCAERPGDVYCWGVNANGQLGNSSIGPTSLFAVEAIEVGHVIGMSSGYSHVCGFRADGRATCWGNNGNGRLGDGAVGATGPYPVIVRSFYDGVSLASMGGSACGLVLGGSGFVLCWGSNNFGQLGNEDNVDRSVPAEVHGVSGPLAIGAGSEHACAFDSEGLKCWGANFNGQLGDATKEHRNAATKATLPTIR